MKFFSPRQPPLNQIDVPPVRGNSVPRLLLEAVKHIYGLGESNRVNHAVGIPVIIFDDFYNSTAAESPHWLCVRILLAHFGHFQVETDMFLCPYRKPLQVVFAAPHPHTRLQLLPLHALSSMARLLYI